MNRELFLLFIVYKIHKFEQIITGILEWDFNVVL